MILVTLRPDQKKTHLLFVTINTRQGDDRQKILPIAISVNGR